jgi:hypothetical protein
MVLEQFQEKWTPVFRPELRKNKEIVHFRNSKKNGNALRFGVSQLAASIVLLAVAGGPALACKIGGRVTIQNGFGTGEEWLAAKEPAARAYVRGYINGLFMSVVIGADETCLDKIADCIEGKTDRQMAAILRKYLNDHPEEWHLPLAMTTYQALTASCLAGGPPLGEIGPLRR